MLSSAASVRGRSRRSDARYAADSSAFTVSTDTPGLRCAMTSSHEKL
jgi:hypothetical protein